MKVYNVINSEKTTNQKLAQTQTSRISSAAADANQIEAKTAKAAKNENKDQVSIGNPDAPKKAGSVFMKIGQVISKIVPQPHWDGHFRNVPFIPNPRIAIQAEQERLALLAAEQAQKEQELQAVNDEIAQVKPHVDELVKQIETKTQEITQLEAHATMLGKEMGVLENNLNKKQGEISLTTQAANASINKTESEIAQRQDKINSLKRELGSNRAVQEKLQEQIANNQREVQVIEQQIEAYTKDRAFKLHQLAALKKELAVLATIKSHDSNEIKQVLESINSKFKEIGVQITINVLPSDDKQDLLYKLSQSINLCEQQLGMVKTHYDNNIQAIKDLHKETKVKIQNFLESIGDQLSNLQSSKEKIDSDAIFTVRVAIAEKKYVNNQGDYEEFIKSQENPYETDEQWRRDGFGLALLDTIENQKTGLKQAFDTQKFCNGLVQALKDYKTQGENINGLKDEFKDLQQEIIKNNSYDANDLENLIKFDARVKDVHQQLTTTLASLNLESEQHRQKQGTISEAITNMKAQYETIKNQMMMEKQFEVRIEKLGLGDRFTQYKSQGNQDQVLVDLEQELSSTEQKIAFLNQEKSTLLGENKFIENKIKTVESKISSIEANLESFNLYLQRAEQVLNEQKAKAAILKTDQEREISTIQSTLQSKQKLIIKNKAELSKARSESSALEKQKLEHQANLEALNSKLASLKAQLRVFQSTNELLFQVVNEENTQVINKSDASGENQKLTLTLRNDNGLPSSN